MGDPVKRNAILDWLFGAPLTGDEPAAQQQSRPPRWIVHTRRSLLLLMVALMTLGLFDLDHRLPVIGPWLAREPWGLTLILAVCMLGVSASYWHHERRRVMRRDR